MRFFGGRVAEFGQASGDVFIGFSLLAEFKDGCFYFGGRRYGFERGPERGDGSRPCRSSSAAKPFCAEWIGFLPGSRSAAGVERSGKRQFSVREAEKGEFPAGVVVEPGFLQPA